MTLLLTSTVVAQHHTGWTG